MFVDHKHIIIAILAGLGILNIYLYSKQRPSQSFRRISQNTTNEDNGKMTMIPFTDVTTSQDDKFGGPQKYQQKDYKSWSVDWENERKN